MSVEEWRFTPMVQDAIKTVEIWRNDGSHRRPLHFAILLADYGIDAETAGDILRAVDAC